MMSHYRSASEDNTRLALIPVFTVNVLRLRVLLLVDFRDKDPPSDLAQDEAG